MGHSRANEPLFKLVFTHCKATNKVAGSINENALQNNFKTHTFAFMLFVQSHHNTFMPSRREEVHAQPPLLHPVHL